jgi:hypothetical protein
VQTVHICFGAHRASISTLTRIILLEKNPSRAEAVKLLLSRAKVKNEWNYTHTPSIARQLGDLYSRVCGIDSESQKAMSN